MPQRDYMARSKQGGTNKKMILGAIIAILLVSGVALWVLKENAPAPIIPENQIQTPKPVANQPQIPTRPEETYSYIRELENREVLVDNNQKTQDKLAQLTEEQKKLAEEKRKQEEARLAQQQAEQEAQAKAAAAQATTNTAESTTLEETAKPQPTAEELAAKKAQEQKLAEQKAKLEEEKRKQAELKKQQELAAKKAAEAQAQADKAKTAQVKAEPAKTETAKAEKKPQPTKIVATAAKPDQKPANQGGRFGLQCGAFKNKAQAENMQARLAMAGFNARINSSADWNRVVVGPVGDRSAASTAQSNARSVAECVIVAM